MSERDFDVQGFARDIHELLILAALRDGSKHGYQIAVDVEEQSNGLFRFRHGTLYPILYRLEEAGLITGSWSKDEGRRKKVYELTTAGRKHLSGEAHRVGDIVSRLMRMLGAPSVARA